MGRVNFDNLGSNQARVLVVTWDGGWPNSCTRLKTTVGQPLWLTQQVALKADLALEHKGSQTGDNHAVRSGRIGGTTWQKQV